MRFVRNRRFDAELERNAEYISGLMAYTEARVTPHVKRRAEQAGEPFMPRGGAAIETTLEGVHVRIYNTDFGAFIAEVGAPSKNTPASAPLRGGAHDAGLTVRES